MMCAKGNLNGLSRPLYIFAIYIKPSLPAEQKKEMIALLVEELLKIKTTETNPMICVGGDFNRMKTDDLTDLVPGLKKLNSPPTRGCGILDLAFCNFEELVTEVLIGPPLENETGFTSDHNTVTVNCSLTSSHSFQWIKYKARKKTETGKERFLEFFRNIDWESALGKTVCPDESV